MTIDERMWTTSGVEPAAHSLAAGIYRELYPATRAQVHALVAVQESGT